MKVAHIIPPAAFRTPVWPVPDYEDPTGAIYMVLPQLMRGPSHYRHFHQDRARRGCFTLLDNGAAEGLNLRTMYALHQMRIGSLPGAEIVLHDVLRDTDATYDVAMKALVGKAYTGPIQGVMQATTQLEIEKLLDLYKYDERITTLGIPRLLLNKSWNARLNLIEYIHDRYPRRFAFHLLGMHGKFPHEPAIIERELPGLVRSVDTSLAYSLASMSETYKGADTALRGRPEDFFDRWWSTPEVRLARDNIDWMNEAFA